jgi:nucleotide-binding universal stress UspA family protein
MEYRLITGMDRQPMSVSSVSSRLVWEDLTWQDPDGGTIVLHGVLPTIVYPRKLRPNYQWHGLALLESEDIVEFWIQEEKDEAESQGVNRSHALISGGTMAIYLDELIELEDIASGRFPDPEPRRVHRLAERHQRPVYFIEPSFDDEGWEEHMLKEAKEVSRWRKLLGLISLGGKWRKRVKKNIFQAKKPPKGISANFASASVLAATWWDLNEWLIGEEISSERNNRFATRLRGALADLRKTHGDEACLLVPLVMPWRHQISSSLELVSEIEEITSNTTDTDGMEEE